MSVSDYASPASDSGVFNIGMDRRLDWLPVAKGSGRFVRVFDLIP